MLASKPKLIHGKVKC